MTAPIVLTVEGLELHAETRDAEPMALDVEIARKGGMAQPRNVRTIVRRALADSAILPEEVSMRTRRMRIAKRGVAGGWEERDVEEYWLSESAALMVLTRMRTDAAIAATRDMIRVFREASRQLRQHPALPPAGPKVDVLQESGVRMGDTPEGRREVRRRCEVTARACGASLLTILGFVRRHTRLSSPYFVGAVTWRTHVLPLLDDLAMGHLLLLTAVPRSRGPRVDPRQRTMFQ